VPLLRPHRRFLPCDAGTATAAAVGTHGSAAWAAGLRTAIRRKGGS
jgi:hypothetical protein